MRLKPINTTLVISTLAIILGIIFQDNFKMELEKVVGITAVGVLLGITFIFWFRKWAFFGVFLAFFSVGNCVYSIHYEPNVKNHYTKMLKESHFYILQGKIISVKNKNAIISLQSTEKEQVKGKILLTFSDTLSPESIGKSILFHTQLYPISSVKNPYQFDYQKYMSRQNVFWRGYVTEFQMKPSTDFSLSIAAQRLQNYLAFSLDKYSFSPDSQGIIKALLLGIRQDIQEEIYQQYIDAGAVHILAISGLHIGIIAMILSYVLHFFFQNKKYKLLILCVLIFFLWSYALLTGLSASVVRSVTMFSFLSIALEVKRHQGIYDNLILSIFILLIFNPLFLFDVGFQLSYLAVFSIVTFLPIFNQLWMPKFRIIRFFYGILAVSLAAQIGVLPISLYYFHQFPTLFFVTNLLVLPFLSLILGVGILVIGLAAFGILPKFLVISYDFLIQLMNTSVGWVASYNDLIIKQLYFDYKMLILSFIGIILWAFWLHFKNIRFLYATLVNILVFQGVLFYNKYKLQTSSELIVFQQYNTTIIGIRQGEKLSVFSSDRQKIPQKYLTHFLSNTNIQSTDFKEINNIFTFNRKTFLVLDDLWYPQKSLPKVDYLLLRNSPKIHLEKLLQIVKPQTLIADGTNAFWDVKKWKETCQKANVIFHSTIENGHFSVKE